MSTTCVITGRGVHGVFDFATGFHPDGENSGRNLDQIACDLATEIAGLVEQEAEIDRELDELCIRAGIVHRALVEKKEALADVEAIADGFNPHHAR